MVGIGGDEHKRAGPDRLVPGLCPADTLPLQDIDHLFLIRMAVQSVFSPGGIFRDIDLQVPGSNIFRADRFFVLPQSTRANSLSFSRTTVLPMQSSPCLLMSSAGVLAPFQNIVYLRWTPLSPKNISLNGFATKDSYVFKSENFLLRFQKLPTLSPPLAGGDSACEIFPLFHGVRGRGDQIHSVNPQTRPPSSKGRV
jgi:hypothetical protein